MWESIAWSKQRTDPQAGRLAVGGWPPPKAAAWERDFMIRWFTIVVLAACNIAIGRASQPTEPFKPGKLPPAEVAALAPGLTVRFYAKPDDAKPLDARRIRLAALHIPKDTPPSPFLPP